MRCESPHKTCSSRLCGDNHRINGFGQGRYAASHSSPYTLYRIVELKKKRQSVHFTANM